NRFDANLNAAERTALEARIQRFDALFRTVHKGDVLRLDYLPDRGTAVSIDGRERGVVRGWDFRNAWLRIWLGPKPADTTLQQQLLGRNPSTH
ncbi:MAG TPA: chalcone isomerase family protein, partial [Acidiferrobacteraceae bacterium]|nr:chalcone isomerase family protein [Acidiferrobacteraceae bacterium]